MQQLIHSRIHSVIALHCIILHWREHTNAYIGAYVRTYAQMYKRTYVRTYIRTYLQTYIRTHVHMSTQTSECIHSMDTLSNICIWMDVIPYGLMYFCLDCYTTCYIDLLGWYTTCMCMYLCVFARTSYMFTHTARNADIQFGFGTNAWSQGNPEHHCLPQSRHVLCSWVYGAEVGSLQINRDQ